MSLIKRGFSFYDIDPESFKLVNLENYLKTYFENGSLNIASEVPILIVDNVPITAFSGGHIEISVSNKHAFYNIFRDLTKDNCSLYKNHFVERGLSKVSDKIKLLVEYEEKYKPIFLAKEREKVWCKLDLRVRLMYLDDLLYSWDKDPECVGYWAFKLDLNKIEFV